MASESVAPGLRARQAFRPEFSLLGSQVTANTISRVTLYPLASEDNRLYTSLVRFEWDPRKAVANLRDHGISFAEAVTVLEDAFALTREDPDAAEERRFVTLGLSDEANMLVVVYVYREPDIIRVLSAWRANKPQRERYEKGRG
jgi:uncharacterized DUF497 family protein